jgi:hypothetical protein
MWRDGQYMWGMQKLYKRENDKAHKYSERDMDMNTQQKWLKNYIMKKDKIWIGIIMYQWWKNFLG